MKVLGLTGGICSGKSRASLTLSRLGCAVIGSDQVGHSIYHPGTVTYEKIIKRFGKQCLSSSSSSSSSSSFDLPLIDRKVLGKMVFDDPSLLKDLNNITWPSIKDEINSKINELRIKEDNILKERYGLGGDKKNTSVVVLEVPLLIEAGWYEWVDNVWVTIVPREEAIRRMNERNGLSREQAIERLNSQMTNEERIKHANVVINTDRQVEETQKQVKEEFQKYMNSISKNILPLD